MQQHHIPKRAAHLCRQALHQALEGGEVLVRQDAGGHQQQRLVACGRAGEVQASMLSSPAHQALEGGEVLVRQDAGGHQQQRLVACGRAGEVQAGMLSSSPAATGSLWAGRGEQRWGGAGG